jgi:hypothetical protein
VGHQSRVPHRRRRLESPQLAAQLTGRPTYRPS